MKGRSRKLSGERSANEAGCQAPVVVKMFGQCFCSLAPLHLRITVSTSYSTGVERERGRVTCLLKLSHFRVQRERDIFLEPSWSSLSGFRHQTVVRS